MTERRRDWLIAAAFFAVSALVRIPFRSDHLFHGDSYGLAAGVLYTLTAHPPGFIGYCALVRIAYILVGDVNLAFVVINVLSTGIATALTYLLGRHMFGRAQGVIAAVIYATSLDTSYFAEVALTYAAEGAFATAAALTGWLSVKRRSFAWLVAHSAVLAIGGSVRQTTLAFLFPLWLFVAWRSVPRWRQRVAAFVVLMLVVWSWSVPNARRLAKYWDKSDISYFESVYKLQVAMVQYYDSTSFGKVAYEPEAARFHWPLVELGVALWNKVHAPSPDAPLEVRTASASNALRMMRYQSAKLLFYLAVALGLATIFVVVALFKRPPREETIFLALWILPSALFFALNHLGAWGYLLIFLAAFAVLAAHAIARLRARVAITAAIAIVNVCVFLFMRPLPETTDRNRTIDIALLQYGAPAIRMGYARSRAKGYTSDPRQLNVDCVTNECLIRDLPKAFALPPDVRVVQPLRRSTISN
ncbi:MAG TPA: glycosyltransferase family 39 protein [Thermoanaerobaculia bacterium]|nr:glycosyltransferase family 39 protein [Thermoanaerobaculia bacterium]